jgi:hypothetical protein
LAIKPATPTTLDQSLADTVAGVFHDAWEDSGLLTILHTQWSIDEYVVTDLSTATAPQFTSVPGQQVGANGAQPLPGQVQAMIDWRTGERGRSFRGRTFFAGFTEGDSDGTPSSTAIAGLNTWASGLIGDLSADSIPLVILSKFSGTHLVSLPDGQVVKRPLARANGIGTAVVSGVAEDVWKTVRRRAYPG